MSIVLGYDESPGARRALELSIDLATRLGEPLVLVFGAAPPGASVGEEFGEHYQAIAELGRGAAAEAVRVAEAAGVATVVEVLPQKPVDALLDSAERHDARVIVVGTNGEAPLRGAILGSVPHKLLHLSARPVLCVPAAGA